MIDEAALIAELRERTQKASQSWHEGAKVTSIEPLTGGTSSLTFTTRFDHVPAGDEVVVLKVAPPGLQPVRNRDVLHQGTVMRALAGRPGVLVPEVLFEDEGSPPEISPFLAMNLVAGECMEPILASEPEEARFGEYRERAFDMASVLASMHRLDPREIGLADQPVVSIDEEINRWVRAYDTSPPHLQFNYTEVVDQLRSSIPEPVRPAVNHGDYRLGNTLCVGGQLRAVIDWEIWSVGDPRVDLAWMTFFCDDAGHPSKASANPSGMPTRVELRQGYVDAGGEAFADMDWFDALTLFKEAALTSLLIKRAEKSADAAMAERMASFTPKLGWMLDMASAKLTR